MMNAARQSFETHGDFATSEILHVFGDRVGVVSIGLDPIEKLGIALAVKGSCLVGDAGGGLSLFPLSPIDSQDVFPAFAFDPPDADDGHERLRLRADRLTRKVYLSRLLCRGRQYQQCEAES